MIMHTQNYQKVKQMPEYISIISSNSCAKIRIEDIEIIEQEGRKLHVATAGKDYTFYGTLDKIAETLAERAFFRPIKGMIVNLDHIEDISGFAVNFRSGQSIALGRNALTNIRGAYKRYLLRYPPYTLWEPMITAGAVAESGEDMDKAALHNENGSEEGSAGQEYYS